MSVLFSSEERFHLVAEVTLKIRQSLELEEILQAAVTEIQHLLQADRVLIFQLASETWGTVVQEAVAPGFPPILGQELTDPCLQEGYLELYRQGQIDATANLEAAESEACHLEWLTQFGVRANLSVPILIREHLWGLLIAHQCTAPRHWNDWEIELVQQLADQIAIAISQAQLLEHLEELVAERTAELTAANQQLQREIGDRLQAEAALRHSEEQLRLITDALPVLISYVDAQQCYRFTNRAYEDWFGPRENINGQPIERVLGTEAYQQIRGYVEAALSGECVTFEREVSYKGSSPRWVRASYIPDLGQQGKVQGFFGLISDISERKTMERLKDEFISLVSHELRTPLTSIHGSLKLLATGRLGELSPDGQKLLQIADENTERLVRLVNDVLDYQRMESGRVTLKLQECDAADLIRRATEAMQGMAQQHDVILAPSLDSLPLWADPDYILQTLTNLLSNAIKFSQPRGTVWVSAQLSSESSQAPSTVLFKVQDQGRGIPADKLEAIFGRFQQVDASDARLKGGTGLGLAICRQIVELHGGRIWAESTLGEGSTFYFTLC
jgi:PAS domain S-box-containing protein